MTDRSSTSGAATLVVDYGYDALDRLSSKKIMTGGSSKIEANVWDDAFLLMQLEGTGGNVVEGASVPPRREWGHSKWREWGHSMRESLLRIRFMRADKVMDSGLAVNSR